MAKAPQVRQFAGDLRFWERGAEGALVAVIPDTDDANGNQPIETNAFTFTYEPGDEIRVLSKRRGGLYNQPIHAEDLPGTTNVSTTLLELPPLILARILFGEGSTAIIAEGTVADAEYTVGNVALPIQLAHRMLKASPAPVIEVASVALVEGTDYSIDLRRGQVMPIAGGDLEEDVDFTISYSYNAQVSTAIVGGATPTKDFYITGDMEDRISGDNGELRVPKASLTVEGDVDWLSAEPIQATLAGPVVVAEGESAPYTFVAYK